MLDLLVLKQRSFANLVFTEIVNLVSNQGWVAWFLIAAALGKPTTIYGNGKQTRDLLWIDDLCDLYIKFWNSDNFPWGTAVNAGGGLANCVSLVELIEVMLKLKIKFNKPAHAEWRQGDQKIFCSIIPLLNNY